MWYCDQHAKQRSVPRLLHGKLPATVSFQAQSGDAAPSKRLSQALDKPKERVLLQFTYVKMVRIFPKVSERDTADSSDCPTSPARPTAREHLPVCARRWFGKAIA
jgi:hypothetical protein